MAQDDDLKLPLTTTAGEHVDEAAHKPVQQTHQHDAQSEPAGRDHQHALPAGIEFLYPTRLTAQGAARTVGAGRTSSWRA